MHLKRACLAIVTVVILGVALPASAADAPSPRSLELANRCVRAMHVERTMDAALKSILATTEQAAAKTPGLTPEESKAVAGLYADLMRDMVAKMMPRIMERYAPILAETFSESELQDLAAFYESPTGQSALMKLPTINAKLTPIILELMPEMQAEMQTRLRALTRELACKRIGCEAPASPEPPANKS